MRIFVLLETLTVRSRDGCARMDLNENDGRSTRGKIVESSSGECKGAKSGRVNLD